jgi:hypothetical protein
MAWLRRIAALSFVLASLPLSAQAPSTSSTTSRTLTPGAGALAGSGNVLTTIQGNALTSTNAPLRDVVVRLRDARTGRIVSTQTTDKAGLFSFANVEPGIYVVELMARDGSTVVAASELLTVNSGDTVSAIVKLTLRVNAFGGVPSGAGSRAGIGALVALAASTGVAVIGGSSDATCPIQ